VVHSKDIANDAQEQSQINEVIECGLLADVLTNDGFVKQTLLICSKISIIVCHHPVEAFTYVGLILTIDIVLVELLKELDQVFSREKNFTIERQKYKFDLIKVTILSQIYFT